MTIGTKDFAFGHLINNTFVAIDVLYKVANLKRLFTPDMVEVKQYRIIFTTPNTMVLFQVFEDE
jgi:hypothetical protein